LGDREGEAVCLADIGVVHRRQGRHQRSLACLRESLAISQQLGVPGHDLASAMP